MSGTRLSRQLIRPSGRRSPGIGGRQRFGNRAFIGVAVLALVGASCQPQGGDQVGRKVVEVGMDDYRFDYDPAILAGRVVFEARNTGEMAHSLDLVPLPEDLPPIEVQLRSQERRALPSFAGVPPRKPGRRGVFAVDLVPGRYAMVCFVKDTEGTLHARKGMASEFRVR